MKKIIIGLLFACIATNANAKVLEVFNETCIPMVFTSDSKCLNVVPSKFEIQAGKSKKIDLNLDAKRDCLEGQHPVFNLHAKSKDNHFQANFTYESQFIEHSLDEPWRCNKLNKGYFCYYVNPNESHPSIKELEYDHNYIYIR